MASVLDSTGLEFNTSIVQSLHCNQNEPALCPNSKALFLEMYQHAYPRANSYPLIIALSLLDKLKDFEQCKTLDKAEPQMIGIWRTLVGKHGWWKDSGPRVLNPLQSILYG